MPRLPNPCKYKNKKKNKIKNRFVQTFKDGANSRSVVNNVKLLLFIKFSLVFIIQEQKKKKKKKMIFNGFKKQTNNFLLR